MCGIALVTSGISIDLSSILDSSSPLPPPPPLPSPKEEFSVDELKSALSRRGPDSIGTKTVILIDDRLDKESLVVPQFQLIGATLQLRGLYPVSQPFLDSSGNLLVYNGEIFGGIDVDGDCNDGEVLMRTLGNCCSCNGSSSGHSSECTSGRKSVPEVLSMIKGPWALIYWQDCSRTLWFGRDAFGRRSLLVHWPSAKDSRFLLSSVSPFSSHGQSSDFNVENGMFPSFWEELTCGIYSLSMDSMKHFGFVFAEVRKHEWANAQLVELIKWERAHIKPDHEDFHSSGCKTLPGQNNVRSVSLEVSSPGSGPDRTSVLSAAQCVLGALRKSVMLRASSLKIFQEVRCHRQQQDFPVAVLYSGGLDSMILAALLNECLDPCYGIDLLNISFHGDSAPDRISAKAGVQELRRIAPLRRWNLVEIDADLSSLTLELTHVMSLIDPSSTYMDLNIGTALWLAARGDGWLSEESVNADENENSQRTRYKSEARIVLVGSGADEQCAGYGRHRTKYRNGSWVLLHEEMKLDMQRIWKRNMGRDDRCIADNGKEARFPFLDEDVISTLLDFPLWEIANLDQPTGVGDKKILREVAQLLGLQKAAILPKRAIQFGSRIAQESNRKNFGSNRAANLASAGSAFISIP